MPQFPLPAPTWHHSQRGTRRGTKGELLWAKPQPFPQPPPQGWVGGEGAPYLGSAPSTLATSTVAVECLPPVSSSELTSHCPLLDLVLSRLTPFLAFTLRRAMVRARRSPPGTPGPPRAPCYRGRGIFCSKSLLAVGNTIQAGSSTQGIESTPAPLFHSILSTPPAESDPPAPVLPAGQQTLWGWVSLGHEDRPAWSALSPTSGTRLWPNGHRDPCRCPSKRCGRVLSPILTNMQKGGSRLTSPHAGVLSTSPPLLHSAPTPALGQEGESSHSLRSSPMAIMHIVPKVAMNKPTSAGRALIPVQLGALGGQRQQTIVVMQRWKSWMDSPSLPSKKFPLQSRKTFQKTGAGCSSGLPHLPKALPDPIQPLAGPRNAVCPLHPLPPSLAAFAQPSPNNHPLQEQLFLEQGQPQDLT